MGRLIDLDDYRNCYIGMDGEYEKWNIDPNVIAEAQPETCDTCKYGYFGDGMCDKCRVGYPSNYERRTDESLHSK